jgi:hypothetical protein
MQKILFKRLMASTPRELGYELGYKPVDVLVGRAAPQTFSKVLRLWLEVSERAVPVRQSVLEDSCGAGDAN